MGIVENEILVEQGLDVLESELLKFARRFQFTQATQLLEKNSAAPVGFVHPPSTEAIRFRAVPSLGFASADIDSCHKVAENLIELHVNFMGLYGPASPLPAYFTEAVIEEGVKIAGEDARHYFLSNNVDIREYQSQRINVTRLEEAAGETRRQIRAGRLEVTHLDDQQMQALKSGQSLSQILPEQQFEQFSDRTRVLEVAETAASRQRDFLDIFNHRLISLYYRSTKKYQPYRDYQRGGNDAFSEQVYALMGAPDAERRAKSVLQWPRLLHFAGLLSMKQASKERIIKVLSGYFGLQQVDVEEGVLRLVDIPDDQLCSLGRQNMILGDDFILGSHVLDRSGKFRVLLQQLDLATFNRFLPVSIGSGEHYQALNQLLQFIKPAELLCDVELELRGDAVPGFSLSADSPCRLGWSTWLGDTHGQSQTVVVD